MASFAFYSLLIQLRHIVPAVVLLLAVHSAVGLVEKVVCIRRGVALGDLQNAATEAAGIVPRSTPAECLLHSLDFPLSGLPGAAAQQQAEFVPADPGEDISRRMFPWTVSTKRRI